jgi:hypothetical protein
MLQANRSAADPPDGRRSMGDEEKCSTVVDDFLHPLHASVLKLLVANRGHLIENQDFRFEKSWH